MKRLMGAVLLWILTVWTVCALAAEAEDLTQRCRYRCPANQKEVGRLIDDHYNSCWRSKTGVKGRLTVTMPEGEEAHSIYLQFFGDPTACQIQVKEGKEWVALTQTTGLYLSEYVPLPRGVSQFRLAPAKGAKALISIAEIHVFAEGEPPAWVHRWEEPLEKADLMVFAAHPDDEMLFMGGSIPYYGGEMGKDVQVVCLTRSNGERKLELLDAVWTCGIRHHPVIGTFKDAYGTTLNKMYKTWNKDKVMRFVTRMYRQYKPEVVVTHDFNGEYGHGAHKVCADAAVHCLETAADPSKYKDTASEYGTWDVKKLYIHLYDQNVVDMDWRRPLEAFGGRTAFEMAQEGFKCHKSQQKTEYVVEDFGPYDNSLFGLYRSLVGADTGLNDFFENIDDI